MKKLFPAIAFLSAFAGSALAGPYDTWASYKTLTVNTTGVALGSDVNDFPLLVRLTNASNGSGANILSGSLSSGADVAFTDSTGNTALKFERERFSSTAAEFWVRVPKIAGPTTNGGVTKIRVYWGKTGVTSLSSGAGVFDKTEGTGNGYQAVYHMNNVGTDTVEANSTANPGLDVASKNSSVVGIAAQIPGAIGFGRSLNTTSVAALTTTGFAAPAALFMVNATTGYSVGAAGAIRKTTNGGTSWTTQTSGTASDLKGIACTDAQSCVAVGRSNTIVHTLNGGTTWTAGTVTGTPLAGSNMYGVTFALASANVVSATNGFIVGDSGQVFSITNFSTTPTYTLTTLGAGSGSLAVYRAIACDNNVCFIGGDAGATRKLTTIGATPAGVATSAMNAAHNIKAVAFTGNALVFSAVGDSLGMGVIYRPSLSNNGTATNNLNRYKVTLPFLSPTLPALTGVGFGVPTANVGGGANASTAGWIVGAGGTVLRTLNTGVNWGQVASGTTQDLAAMAVPMGTTANYASHNGIAATSTGALISLNGKFGQYFASGSLGTTTAADSSVLNFKEAGPFTVSAWLNPEYFDGAVHNITTKGDKAWVLQMDGSTGNNVASRWNVAVYGTVGGVNNPTNSYTNWYSAPAGTATAAGTPVATTGWNHIVGTRKSTDPALPASTELYVNGVLSNGQVPGTNTNTSNDRTFNVLLTIGKTLDGGGTGASDRFWMGGLDEFRYTSTYQDSNYVRLSFETQKAASSLLTQGAAVSTLSAPSNLAYSPDSAVFKKDTAIANWTPSVTGTVTSWSIAPALPAGLSFSTTTGVISGTPTAAQTVASYTVTATNSTGSTTKVIKITVTGPVAIQPGAFVFSVNGQDKPYAFQLPAGMSSEKVTLSIIDAWGRTIWAKSVNPDKTTEVSWNGKSANGRVASAGMYVARVSVLNGKKTTVYTNKAVSLKP